MLNKDMRDCKNCEYYVSYTMDKNSPIIQGCKKWECEFKVKEDREKRTIKITVTFDEIKRLSKEELADLIMLRLNKMLELEK